MIHLSPQVNEFTQRDSNHPPPPKKRRRILIGLLILQLLLLFLIFPLLFVYFENDQPSQEPELTEELSQGNEPVQAPSFIDGLYWSLITPIPLSSNDNWPQTRQGQILVRVSDVTKLLTLGTTAALYYDTVITRRLQDISRSQRFRSRRSEDDEGAESEIEREWTFDIEGEPVTFRIKGMKKIAPMLIAIFLKVNGQSEGKESEPPPKL